MAKLRIDLATGILEVEGDEAIVKEVYQDFKDKIQTWVQTPSRSAAPVSQTFFSPQAHSQTSPPPASPVTRPAAAHKFTYNIVKNLDLSFRDHDQSLKDYFAEKLPRTALETNAVFVYYLQKIAGVKGITIDHIYTCYKDVKTKVPGALRQSVIDTSFKKGWIDTKSLDDITITIQGENMVEHDLPKQKS